MPVLTPLQRRRMADILREQSAPVAGTSELLPSPGQVGPDRRFQIERNRRIAERLLQTQMPEGQMVGPFYVAPHPLSYLAALGGRLAGAWMERRADRAEAELAAAQDRALRETNQTLIHELTREPRPSRLDASGQPIPGTEVPELLDVETGRPMLSERGQRVQAVIGTMDPGRAHEFLVGQALQRLFPPTPEAFTLSPGQARFVGGQKIAELPPEEPKPTDDEREYERARREGYTGSFQDWILAQRRAGASQVNVNTEKSLYGTLAEQRAKRISELYDQAAKAPEILQRAQRVKALLAPGSEALTGAGANWMLVAAKIANQLGINTGNAASDTELLAAQLAASTLDAIKTSGLGSGTGFSNADRDFLERVVGGEITLEADTLRRIADLNERAARRTIERWNATVRRLDPEQLRALGLGPIELDETDGSDLSLLSDEELLRRLRGG